MRCYRRLLDISYKDYKDHNISNKVARRIEQASRHCESLLFIVKRRKLKWFGHVARREELAKIVLLGTVRGGRKRGRQKKRWEDNITEWTGLKFPEAVIRAENREEWRYLIYNSTSVVSQLPWPWDWLIGELLYPKLLILVNCLHCTAVSEMMETTTDDSTINFLHLLIFNVKSLLKHLHWLTCFIVLKYTFFCCCTDVLDRQLLLLLFVCSSAQCSLRCKNWFSKSCCENSLV